LSVTTEDNPIFKVLKNTNGVLYTKINDESVLQGIVEIKAGTKLRLLRCRKAETGSAYQWGDGLSFVMLDNSLTAFVSGNLGVRYTGDFGT